MRTLMTLMLVLLAAGTATAQPYEWIDDLNLPETGVYWEYLGYAAATADTFWTVAPTLAAGTASAATGYYAPKSVPRGFDSTGSVIKTTRKVRFFVVTGIGEFAAQVYQNGQAAPTAGATGVGYAYYDSNLWNKADIVIGAGQNSNLFTTGFAVEWPDTLHLTGLEAGQADSVKVYVGY